MTTSLQHCEQNHAKQDYSTTLLCLHFFKLTRCWFSLLKLMLNPTCVSFGRRFIWFKGSFARIELHGWLLKEQEVRLKTDDWSVLLGRCALYRAQTPRLLHHLGRWPPGRIRKVPFLGPRSRSLKRRAGSSHSSNASRHTAEETHGKNA